ncbi:phage/plasmid replication protein, II/X family [Amphritea japonica]|uniref:Phage/plasmid replication protein n=1 Tax=Amphritea japonica ATCC BAA-1530 TaxID=1278309 RepID=A0A7R6PB57_9GAMM|nr:phage/plasmid replication protein, II/X family [Amphritea japonica]BBB26243.1 phage/plasmid replication protein [Amphritea japonica ATCC BAA-1530]
MIDWVTGKLPCLHAPLKSGSVMKVSPEGEVEWSTLLRVAITGSFESSINVKSLGSDGQGHAEFLHVDGNPTKFVQGHNVFGTDDISEITYMAAHRIVSFLIESGAASVFLSNSMDYPAISNGDFEIDRIDINYMFELPSRSDVNAWLRAAEYNSHTRHGRAVNSKGTVYWGKNSRRWSLKAYCKAAEIEGGKKHRLPEGDRFTKLKDWVQNKLRLELTLRQLELRKLGIVKAKDLRPERVKEIYNEYIGRLEMGEKVILNDEESLAIPRSARCTYLMWKQGMVPFDMLPKPTFYRHRKQLLEHGVDISNPPPVAASSNVVPMLKVLEAKPVEIPQWAYDQRLIAVA